MQATKKYYFQRVARRIWRLLIITATCLALFSSASAQQENPPGPIYIVQEGDSLWGIAARFSISLDQLQAANNINDPSLLKIGDRLVLPGFEGVEGVLGTIEIPYGESLRSLQRHYRIPGDLLIRLNRLISPTDLYAGFNLILPEQEAEMPYTKRAALQSGQSLLELAVQSGASPWELIEVNDLPGSWSPVPGDVLRTIGNEPDAPGALPGVVNKIAVEPMSLQQGKAATIQVDTAGSLALAGSLIDRPLHFYPAAGQGFFALQGVHAMTEPGIYPLEIQGTAADGSTLSFMQMVPLRAVDYPYDQPLAVDPATIDPAVTKPEDAQWSALTEAATPDRLWNGKFLLPSPLEKDYCLETGDCWSSRFGNRRSYNGSPYLYFHTGLDVVGKTGTDIVAPADGQVVFAGPLTVRGNATMINHGQGVYSGYMHQSEIYVKPGDFVKAGQVIGKVGGTGRVQGPHLHWEVWVGGVQVDPIDWLERVYP